MGTAGYMSPEQVKGFVDHRSDIFSFGAILHELLSGQRAFMRETNAETIAAILRDEPPDLLESGQSISPALDRIVRHCLELAALADGLSEDIVTGLSRFSYLKVIARSSTSRYVNASVDARAAGRELGARYLEGSFSYSCCASRRSVMSASAFFHSARKF